MTMHPALAVGAETLSTFFTSLGRGLSRAAASTHEAVDPDARRDLAWMPVLALASLGPRRQEVRALPDDGHRIVVCVHGLAGSRGNFLPLRTWLRLHGRTRSYSVQLDGATIPDKAEELRAFVAEVARVNELPPGRSIDLVAHSMGGLVSRLALRDPATAERVHTLLTLGTPHQGTHAARFVGGPLMTDLRHDSPLMEQLRDDLPWQSPIRLVCFWSPSDPLMQPAQTARVPGAESRQQEGFSHLDWLMRRQAWMLVDGALRTSLAPPAKGGRTRSSPAATTSRTGT